MSNAVPASNPFSRPRVQILDDVVVNQIAAGEVVERPASVVKELVENAIDAGARSITVVIENGGQSLIEIIDDGCGMSREDAQLAVQRFGTSKISRADDLQSISTLGFRGEALPSIASVSRLLLETREQDSSGKGIVLEIVGGRQISISDCDLPSGTRIRVRQLFFNVPARKRFLKTEKTELGIIKALIQDFSLSVPWIRFRLVAEGAEVLSFSPAENFIARAKELKLAGQYPLIVSHKAVAAGKEINVEALLSQPIDVVPTSNRLRFIVNGRIVRDRLLLAAVRQGYGNFLKGGKYPSGAVLLTVPPADVDVNVHPQKSEVRFRNSDAIFSAIVIAIRKALEKSSHVPEAIPSPIAQEPKPEISWLGGKAEDKSFARNEAVAGALLWQQESNLVSRLEQEAPSYAGSDSVQPLTKSSAGESPFSQLSQLKYLGQIFACYLLFSGNEKFVIVDMHAAHERVVFYRLKSQLQTGKLASQLLLVPEVVELPSDQLAKLISNQEKLLKLGIEIEIFGENSLLVRSMPSLIKSAPGKIFAELFSLGDWSDWGEFVGNKWDDAIARIACHGSIRSGRELEPDEAYELVSSLSEAECSGLCPHGRPIVKEFSRSQIEAMFGRI